MRCSRVACVLLLPLLLAGAGRALEPGKPLPPGPEGELLAIDAKRVRAQVDADIATVRELCGDELRFIHSNGNVETKYVFLAALESGRLDYLSIQTSDETVHVYGEAGFVSGNALFLVKTADGSRLTIANVYTAVYAKREGDWRLVLYQSTPAVKAPPVAD
jgi:ketosteroid isomerase-like protein